MNATLDVSFVVERRPEDDGLRIRTTNPTGLYVSSRDAEAAKHYFQVILLMLAVKNRFLRFERKGGISSVHEIEWDRALANGNGKLTIQTESYVDVFVSKCEGSLIRVPEPQELAVQWFKSKTTGQFTCVISDPDNDADEWLLHTLITDEQGKT